MSTAAYENITAEDYDSERFLSGFYEGITKYLESAPKRVRQAKLLKEHMNTSPYPVIMGGDFNDGPMSYSYRKVKSGLGDAFITNGAGWGTSWEGSIPMLRIDYLFYDKDIMKNTGFECVNADLSDHYPVKASFTWD